MQRRQFLQATAALLPLQPALGLAASSRLKSKPIPKASPPQLPVPSLEPLLPLLPNIGDAATDTRHRAELADFLSRNRHVRSEVIGEIFRAAIVLPSPYADRSFMQKGAALSRVMLGLFVDDSDTIASRVDLAAANVALEVSNDHGELFTFLRKKYSDLDSAEAFTCHGLLRATLLATYNAKKSNVRAADINTLQAKLVVGERERQDRIVQTAHTVLDICKDLNFPLQTDNGFVLSFRHVEVLFNEESQFDPKAANGSKAGGLSQFMPQWWMSTLSKLPTMPHGDRTMEYARQHWPDIGTVGARLKVSFKNLSGREYQDVMAMRFEPRVAAPIAFSYILDEGQRMMPRLGARQVLTPGHMWLSNVTSSLRTTAILSAMASAPKRLVNALTHLGGKRVIPDIFMMQNAHLFGSPKKPFTVQQVIDRVNMGNPIAPFVLAREIDPALLKKREDMLAMEAKNMQMQTPVVETAGAVRPVNVRFVDNAPKATVK